MDILDIKSWQRPSISGQTNIRQTTAAMLAEIQADGAAAIRRLSLQFDNFEPELIPLKPFEAYPLTDDEKAAIRHAAGRIQRFAELQLGMYHDVAVQDDCGTFGHRIEAMDSMTAYIPGGRYPLISTALMTLIPAGVAGVGRRVAISPSLHPALLAAASLAGANEFIHLGGAQAIAAAAYGYDPLLKPTDMVVGPGNAFVNAAKDLLQSRIKIDTLAGPSELLILADDSPDPTWIGLDMLAQAEHDPLALSVLCSTDRGLLESVRQYLQDAEAQAESGIGVVNLVQAQDSADLLTMAETMAPEHLSLMTRPGFLDSRHLRHYGSLFVGAHSAVALGDYCSGPNHTLPTSGYARVKGGLHVGDFLKVLTVQEVSPTGFQTLAKTAETLARLEGLEYHGKSLAVRRQSKY